jgi:hypothetical protein
MLKTIAKGSKEELIVDFSDRRGLEADLSDNTPKFEVYDYTNTNFKVGTGAVAGATAATGVGLSVVSLVDTSSGGGWAVGDYALYVYITVGSQVIRKGPFDFSVVA